MRRRNAEQRVSGPHNYLVGEPTIDTLPLFPPPSPRCLITVIVHDVPAMHLFEALPFRIQATDDPTFRPRDNRAIRDTRLRAHQRSTFEKLKITMRTIWLNLHHSGVQAQTVRRYRKWRVESCDSEFMRMQEISSNSKMKKSETSYLGWGLCC